MEARVFECKAYLTRQGTLKDGEESPLSPSSCSPGQSAFQKGGSMVTLGILTLGMMQELLTGRIRLV